MTNELLLLYVDGGCKYDGTGIYFSVADHTFQEIKKWADRKVMPEYGTNNEAEYCALIFALEELLRRKWSFARPCDVVIHCDSKLIVNQCTDKWRIKEPRLQKLKSRVDELIREVSAQSFNVRLVWVGREENVKRLGH
jgi:ribonuclease HI